MSIVPGRDVPAVPDAWIDAVNAAINDAHHEDLCMCDSWPGACASGYQSDRWDLGVSLTIAVGVLEPLIRERIAAESETISTVQAADILGVARVTVVRFCDDGRLPYTKPGKHRRLRLADVLAFKAETTHEAVT
jgi:excisionase family DNA binding protein